MIGLAEPLDDDVVLIVPSVKEIQIASMVRDVKEETDDDVVVLSSAPGRSSALEEPVLIYHEVSLEDCTESTAKRIKLDQTEETDKTKDLAWYDKSSIPAIWLSTVDAEMSKTYFKKMCEKIDKEECTAKIFPPRSLRFSFMNYDPSQIKVVIIGQDPYHGVGQAHGLSFSVEKGTKIPPSLKNIYKELKSDLGDLFKIPEHGNLSGWAGQGVLLLNASLTVAEGKPNSHSKYGWTMFTDAIIRKISRSDKRLVIMLWGGFAQKKGAGILV